jgi:hypothetical protein
MTLYDIFRALIQSVMFWSIGHDVSEPDNHLYAKKGCIYFRKEQQTGQQSTDGE